jgi:hypothetical protein
VVAADLIWLDLVLPFNEYMEFLRFNMREAMSVVVHVLSHCLGFGRVASLVLILIALLAAHIVLVKVSLLISA